MVQANGQTVESEGPLCSVGECCEVVGKSGMRSAAEVIGFRGHHVVSMPLDETRGIQYGDRVQGLGARPSIAVGEAMIGRVLNAVGAAARWAARAQDEDVLAAGRGDPNSDGAVPHSIAFADGS